MIEIRQGSLISKLLYILTITGEFPVHSISLLGSYQSQRRLINKATSPCEYLNVTTQERYSTTLLTIVGKGRRKSLRFLSGAEKILEWLGLWKLFKLLHGSIHYRGDIAHIDRTHRIAEGYAMAYMAGLEINPLSLPKLQQEEPLNLFKGKQCFYGSRLLKHFEKIEMNKTA